MRNYFQHPLEGHSDTSNDQALLSPFDHYDHYVKMKEYMRAEWDILLKGSLPSPTPLTMFIGTR